MSPIKGVLLGLGAIAITVWLALAAAVPLMQPTQPVSTAQNAIVKDAPAGAASRRPKQDGTTVPVQAPPAKPAQDFAPVADVTQDPAKLSAAAAQTSAKQAGQTRQVAIWDPAFNMPAYSMTIPADWQFEGTMLRLGICSDGNPVVVYRASSPDMLTGIQRLPPSYWLSADDPKVLTQSGLQKCKVQEPMSASAYATKIAPEIRPGSQLGTIEIAPRAAQLAESIKKANEMFASSAAQQGNPNPWRFRGEAQRIRVRYDFSGHPVEEWLTVVARVTDRPTTLMGSYPNGVMKLDMKHILHSSAVVIGLRAPQGQLDAVEQKLVAIDDSARINPEYQAKYNAAVKEMGARLNAQMQANGAALRAQGAAANDALLARGRAFNEQQNRQADARRAQFNADMARKDQNNQAFQAQMDARSGRNQDRVDQILDQQYFYDSSTGKTTTQSNQFNYSYSNGNGAVVQTNSPTFDPNAQLPGSWTQLQPIHH
jgi:hypothetical protein